MHVIVARLSNIYGPGDDFEAESAHLIGNTIRLVAKGEAPEIWGDGSQLRSYLYVTSAVEAILRLTEAGTVQGPINIGGQVEYSVRDIVDLIIEISGQPLQAIFHPEHPTGLGRKLLDITRFQELIGLGEEVSLKEGLQRTYDWYLGSKHCRPPQVPPP
jgi:nucleoside-diphosphate-sugar epimerase